MEIHFKSEAFTPDYAVPPGDTLRDLLEEREMTQAELARRMGRPRKTINGIVQGKVQITPEIAIELERVFSIPARIWLALESNYRSDVARIAVT
jgi:addiction module HigA family antidote